MRRTRRTVRGTVFPRGREITAGPFIAHHRVSHTVLLSSAGMKRILGTSDDHNSYGSSKRANIITFRSAVSDDVRRDEARLRGTRALDPAGTAQERRDVCTVAAKTLRATGQAVIDGVTSPTSTCGASEDLDAARPGPSATDGPAATTTTAEPKCVQVSAIDTGPSSLGEYAVADAARETSYAQYFASLGPIEQMAELYYNQERDSDSD